MTVYALHTIQQKRLQTIILLVNELSMELPRQCALLLGDREEPELGGEGSHQKRRDTIAEEALINQP